MLMNGIFGDDFFNQFFDELARPVKSAAKGLGFANMPQVFPQGQPTMRTDIKESAEGYELEIELPGYSKDNITAELKDGYMTITAKQEEVNEEVSEDEESCDVVKYIRRERCYGTCKRSFYVGEEITEQDIKARFENGVLILFVPKKEPEKIEEEKTFINIEG